MRVLGVTAVSASILIKGGTVVNDHLSQKADVLVDGGKIKDVGQGLSAPGATVIDATGKFVMPGGIDPHTHLDMPFMGQVACDDYSSGHRAALAGGTTMHIDFALPVNGSLLLGYEEWSKKGLKANMDFGFHMAVTAWNEKISKEMEVLVKEKGVNSFKFFLAYKNALMVTDEELVQALARCKELGALAMVHAENGEAVFWGQKHVVEKLKITGPEGHALSRPASVEEEATNRAIVLSEVVQTPLYVVHVMSKGAMEACARGKMRGARIICEPTLAGLVLDESAMWDKDFSWAAAHVMSPPIRKHAIDGVALQDAIRARVLDVIATDHAVFNTTQKAVGKKDFRILPNGVNGLEERLPVIWSQMVETGKLSHRDFVRVTSADVARIFNVYPRKGAILPGSDADLYILDPSTRVKISAKTHHSNLDINVFEGFETPKISTTISRGKVAWDGKKLLTSDGDGKRVDTPPYPFLFDGLEKETKLMGQAAWPMNGAAQGRDGKAEL